MSEHIHHVTDDSFDPEVLQSQLPVLVDYWAEWCGPCKMVAPILDEVAKDYAGRLKVAKLDIDQNDKIAVRFGVRGIPTLMLFKNGAVAAQKVGWTRQQLEEDMPRVAEIPFMFSGPKNKFSTARTTYIRRI